MIRCCRGATPSAPRRSRERSGRPGALSVHLPERSGRPPGARSSSTGRRTGNELRPVRRSRRAVFRATDRRARGTGTATDSVGSRFAFPDPGVRPGTVRVIRRHRSATPSAPRRSHERGGRPGALSVHLPEQPDRPPGARSSPTGRRTGGRCAGTAAPSSRHRPPVGVPDRLRRARFPIPLRSRGSSRRFRVVAVGPRRAPPRSRARRSPGGLPRPLPAPPGHPPSAPGVV